MCPANSSSLTLTNKVSAAIFSVKWKKNIFFLTFGRNKKHIKNIICDKNVS